VGEGDKESERNGRWKDGWMDVCRMCGKRETPTRYGCRVSFSLTPKKIEERRWRIIFFWGGEGKPTKQEQSYSLSSRIEKPNIHSSIHLSTTQALTITHLLTITHSLT